MAQTGSPTNAAMAARLERDVANLNGELNIAKRKLSSKSEALIILSADLDACRTERDQYKLMAEQLQSRHVAIKKQLAGVVDEGRSGGDLDVDQLWRLLAEHQAKSKSVALEAEDLKQRLSEAEGDNRALREQLGRHRMGEDDEAVSRRSWSASEREALVATLEEERRKTDNLKRDMREVLDQKEELVVERDALKSKHERLNKEMNLMLRGDPERILDLDALTMENAYLKQELSRTKEEQTKAAATLSKYRGLLEKRMNKVMGAGRAKMILDDHSAPTAPSSATITATGLPPSVDALGKKLLKIAPDRASPQAVAHLQKFVVFLQESLQDRSLAISHQRKTNQILGKKIQILENRLRNQDQPRQRRSSGCDSNVAIEDDRPDFHDSGEDVLADSLENCCISTSQDSKSEMRSSNEIRSDEEFSDFQNGASGLAAGQSTFQKTNIPDDDDDDDDDRNEEDDDTHSVAESFCDFQSAATDFPGEMTNGRTPHLPNQNERNLSPVRVEGPSILHLTDNRPETASLPIPSSQDRTPTRDNALFKTPRNLEDLLSWEFDDHCDSRVDNPLSRSGAVSTPAILSPTILQ